MVNDYENYIQIADFFNNLNGWLAVVDDYNDESHDVSVMNDGLNDVIFTVDIKNKGGLLIRVFTVYDETMRRETGEQGEYQLKTVSTLGQAYAYMNRYCKVNKAVH